MGIALSRARRMNDGISPNIVILTRDELRAKEDAAFQRGVQRGRFEAAAPDPHAHVARNCANWNDGRCESCGVQWQDCEVGPDFKCPHFMERTNGR